MSDSVFTQIRKGKLPGYMLYSDSKCFVILSIEPHNPGHVLIIPNSEIANWQDLDDNLLAQLTQVSKQMAKIIKDTYHAPKIALVIAGFDIEHVHIHVFSLFEPNDSDSINAKKANSADLEKQANILKSAIASSGGLS